MTKLLSSLLLASACALPLACSAEVEAEATPSAEAASAEVHRVECGCSDEVSASTSCGNYIEVDGAFVELAGDLGLSAMEWCHDPGHKARVSGGMVDGKFVATSLEVIE